MTNELTTLRRYLNGQRTHVIGILEGADEAALRRPVLPSGWSCLGLVQHLALDVEQFWFRGTIAGDPIVPRRLATDPPSAWVVAADTPASHVIEAYRREISLADAVLNGVTPDDPPAWWPENVFGDFRLDTVREILLHVITETAGHAGHLDAAREIIDGRQWLVLE